MVLGPPAPRPRQAERALLFPPPPYSFSLPSPRRKSFRAQNPPTPFGSNLGPLGLAGDVRRLVHSARAEPAFSLGREPALAAPARDPAAPSAASHGHCGTLFIPIRPLTWARNAPLAAASASRAPPPPLHPQPSLCRSGAGVLLADTWGPPGTPRPCQAPQQWEGRQVLYRQSSGRNSRALLSYDGLNRRVRVLDERKALVPCRRLFEYILLYKDGVMFQIEQATKQCSKITLTDPWDPLDIPQNSTFEDQYSIGGPQEQITVQEWSDRKSARSYETWIGIYTVKDCYPVQETFTKNYSVILSTRFFDIQLGIKDPSVFIPPSTCQTAQLERMSEDCSW
ncbi:PREDICTED: mammalian ependymin-related protein 1 [Miniopterus natalensis]|uniref:mammalian ependymin-related protein 1 n=1 Tax=Miniopterus natalensis TaxID=291302 RepID=UPI0007A6D43E|nr:PREDICTED: mammalian ependymin-related protein 1 [Miniopterus natalensis]